MRKYLMLYLFLVLPLVVFAIDNKGIVAFQHGDNTFALIKNSIPVNIVIDDDANSAVSIAAANLAADFGRVCGTNASVIPLSKYTSNPASLSSNSSSQPTNPLLLTSYSLLSPKDSLPPIYVGTIDSQIARKSGIDISHLRGKRETYILHISHNSIFILGSDRRGAVYGIYELSEQIGVSPWYDWADVPVIHRDDIAIRLGSYTNSEPAVRYRGIFINDEAPCLTSWVKNTYDTNFGDHRFYARVFELILRLRGNLLWPAMWSWAFYADDSLNSKLADEMGVIIGTSHHEPMARNHQEYARNRDKYGKWNYATNQTNLDNFFAEGIKRMRNTEDIVTIGMRGDGDEAMSQSADVDLLKRVIKNQRNIIKKVTGKSAEKTPQVWALYKEVLDYYDKGLRAPDDVTYLLCDDNWGNIRRLPNASERNHPGGWGMYYHVDYVGAPRNSKWLNCTPIQNMYEQMQLTYAYGVDRLWILNVGDIKPMEYPITLFLDMAWNPSRFTPQNLHQHTIDFCAQQFGADQATEAARILDLYCKFAGRVTPEMLNKDTYNLASGEWRQVADDFARLELDATRQYNSLLPSGFTSTPTGSTSTPTDSLLLTSNSSLSSAYKQLILFPVQAMANLYDLYYSQAMNHLLYAQGDAQANLWADRALRAFNRDAQLINDYNNIMSGGKWRGMMSQKHIGYTSWNDDFPADTLPELHRIQNPTLGGFTFSTSAASTSAASTNPASTPNTDPLLLTSYSLLPQEGSLLPDRGYISIEAEHYYSAEGNGWTVIPNIGRTLSGITVMPYTDTPSNQRLNYQFELPSSVSNITVHVIVKSTLAFSNKDGHRYSVSLNNSKPTIVNFNANLNENPENIYSVFYPTVARRVVENTIQFSVADLQKQPLTLSLQPLDPGIVFEKIVIDYGGYTPSYLFGNETSKTKNK